VYTDSKDPYFKNFEDYNNKSADPIALLAAQNLANMLYGLENDYEEKLPENKFLKQYKFVDSKLRLINKEGKLVDEKGRLINENGRYINEAGQFVDKDGNIVNEDGDYVVEFSPFLDDEGKPVVLESEQKSEEPKKEEVNATAPVTPPESSN
jgi:hypothetical protein